MMAYILNFNVSRYLDDVLEDYHYDRKTNIDFMLEGFEDGTTNWSVPKNAVIGDTVVFMCAKSAKNNIGMATSHIPEETEPGFVDFAGRQKALYKKYSGFLLGYGTVASSPNYVEGINRWYSNIDHLCRFTNTISLDEFKNFITINSRSSITALKDDQWDRLRQLIKQKNPELFPGTALPEIGELEDGFQRTVEAMENNDLSKLMEEAGRKAKKPTPVYAQTKFYNREPAIAAYAKKRANGFCQLCGQKAPFVDHNGKPYLECHHLHWLSEGGEDSPENCVALCPNCHRRMHIVNDPSDIEKLRSMIKGE